MPEAALGGQSQRLHPGKGRAAVAFAAAVCLAGLALLEFLRPRFLVATHFHEQFIPVPVGLAVLSGLLALRTYAYGGSRRTLAYGLGFVAFAAIYLWHGVFTNMEVPFGFLAYGPLARIVLATALLLGLSNLVDPDEVRFTRIGVGLAACLLLGVLAFAAYPALERFAQMAGVGTVQAVRLGLEGFALLLTCLAIVQLLRPGAVPVTPLIPFGLTFNAGQSLLFMAADPWDWTWWTAHAVGGIALTVLAWAVIVVERDELRAREARRWKNIAELQTGFINAAAHQLNTPLTAMRLTIRTIKARTGHDPGLHDQVLLVERNIERLGETVGELVEATILANAAKGPRQPIDFHQALQLACAQLAIERPTGHEPQVDAHAPVLVSVHADILRHVLLTVLRTTTPDGPLALQVDRDSVLLQVPRGQEETEGSKLRLHLASNVADQEGIDLDLQEPGWIRLRVPLQPPRRVKRSPRPSA